MAYKKVTFHGKDEGSEIITYTVDISKHEDFGEYIYGRMDGNHPIELDVVFNEEKFVIMIHPRVYSECIITIKG